MEDEALAGLYRAACTSHPRPGPPLWGDVSVVREWSARRVRISLIDVSVLDKADVGTLLRDRLFSQDELSMRVARWLAREGVVEIPADAGDPHEVVAVVSECLDQAVEYRRTVLRVENERAQRSGND